MNDGITHFLNRYVQSNAPGYAVLLKGAWGSGKSYFIKKWMETLQDETVIYVSLFGLGSAAEIQETIRRSLYPIYENNSFEIRHESVLNFV